MFLDLLPVVLAIWLYDYDYDYDNFTWGGRLQLSVNRYLVSLLLCQATQFVALMLETSFQIHNGANDQLLLGTAGAL